MKSIVLHSSVAEAQVYLHGAHVTHFQPRGEKPVLFVSAKSWFQPDKPIRGGVPICFPWFGHGPDPLMSKTPAHGVARLREWVVEQTTSNLVVFSLKLFPLQAQFTVEVEKSLKMTFEVRNVGNDRERFEAALHTYLAVGDIREVTVSGLENTDYLDNTENLVLKRQDSNPIQFTGETDRVYLNTHAPCVVTDPVWKRRLIVEKSGSEDTVVWNPWIAKAKAMVDFGDDEWSKMLCIETANVKANAVSLAPDQTHVMQAMLCVEPLS